MRRFAWIWVVLAACSAPQSRTDVADVKTEIVAPGAERWNGDALRLPRHAPVAAMVQPDQIENGLAELIAWGADAELYRDKAGLPVGALFLSNVLEGKGEKSLWSKNGGDLSRPVYAGMRPLDAEGRRFVDAVEAVLAAKLRTAPEKILEALGNTPSPVGLHNEIIQQVASLRPVLAGRVVLPCRDTSAMTALIERQAGSLGWKRATPEEIQALGLGPLGRAYLHDDLELPTFSVRVAGDIVLVDGVFSGMPVVAEEGENSRNTRLGLLANALHSTEPGRPDAPRLAEHSDLIVGFDTAAVADLVKLRGYRRALTVATRLDATRRDELLVFGLRDTMMTARAWQTRSAELPGLAYSLNVGDEKGPNAFELEMTLFLGAGQPEVRVPPADIGMSVDERGLAGSFSLAPFNDPTWKQIIRIADPVEALDILDAGDADPVPFGMALPRLVTLILGNLVDAGPNALNPLSDLMAVIPSLERVEFAWLGNADLTSRKLILLGVVKPGATTGDQALVASHLTQFGANLAGLTRTTEPFELGPRPTAIGLVGSEAYGVATETSPRHVMVGLGMGLVEFELEQQRLSVAPAVMVQTGTAVTFRAEPTTWIPLLQHFPLLPMYVFDTAVLAQRLGPVEMSMMPEKDGSTQSLRWRIEWKRPPRL